MSNIARIMQMAGSVSNEGGFPVTDNLILLLDANDSASYPGSGTDVYDLSPEGNDGVLTNGVTHNGTYFEFDGDNDYIDLGTITTANPLQLSSPAGGGMSVTFASYFDDSGDTYQRIIDKSVGGNAANGWAIYCRNAGTPSASQMQFNVNLSTTSLSSSTNVASAGLQIWTLTWNSSTGALAWYLNGVLDNSGTYAYLIPSFQTNARIATWNHSDARELNGRIGYIAVHEKPLTSTEVTAVFDHYKDIYGL